MHEYPSTHVPYYVNTFSRLDPLIFGTSIAFAIRYIPNFAAVTVRFSILCFCASAIVFVWASNHATLFTKHDPFALTIFDLGWAVFVLSALTFKPIVDLFSNKYLASFGRLTYGMYVIHAMVIQAIATHIVKPLGFASCSNMATLLGLLLGLPATFLLAWLLWHAYEKHFYKLKYRFSPVKSGFMAN